jgi:hypothetical protein
MNPGETITFVRNGEASVPRFTCAQERATGAKVCSMEHSSLLKGIVVD